MNILRSNFSERKESNLRSFIHFIPTSTPSPLQFSCSFSKSIAFSPLRKRKILLFPRSILPQFSLVPPFYHRQKKGKPHDDAQVLATGKRSESVERGRPMIRMERYSSQTDLRPFTPELTRVFVVVQGGRGTGNPGLTFSRMGRRRWLNREPSRSSCKHRLNGDQRRKRHKRPALSPWTVIFLPGRETSVRPFERL